MPLNLLPVGDVAADSVEVNSGVADNIEICIVDEIFEAEEVDDDMDVDIWEVEVEEGSVEDEGVMVERTQSEHDKGV